MSVFDDLRFEKSAPQPEGESSVFDGGLPFFKFGVRDMASNLYTANLGRDEAAPSCHTALGLVMNMRGYQGDSVYDT